NNLNDQAIIPNPIAPDTMVPFTYLYTTPVADAGQGAPVVSGSNVVLNGTGSMDIDGGPQPLSFSWQQIYGPQSVTIVNEDQVQASAVLNTPGTYIFRLTVDDSVSFDTDEVVFLVSQTVSLFPAGRNWRYFDQGVDLGTAWRMVGYDDSTWSNGFAQLGYGDGDETTVVSFGPSSSSKYRTTYFRTEFVATNVAEISHLRFNVLRDDGAVVYLNGVEQARPNMTNGFVRFGSPAGSVVGGSAEDTFFPHLALADDLVEGTNLLAVEIHQISGSSSDISFDLFVDTEVTEIDEDNDGMPDWWEVIHFGDTNQTGGANWDNDPMSNLEEFVAGTDPDDPGSYLVLHIANSILDTTVYYDTVSASNIVFNPTNRFYTLETATNAVSPNWQTVPGYAGHLGDDNTLTYTNIPP
ncbi:MAG: hypothetical protein AAF492_27485, partial [Verrucomicrobiota bacterium]